MVYKADFFSWSAVVFGFIGIASSNTATKELALQKTSKMIA
jgi:hypothetical protein